MVYLGREIWLFLTEEGRPGALYSVSGRSPPSRQREAVYYPDERRVAIEPLDKSQIADALRHYNAMKFDDDLLVVSNGLHTENIFDLPNRRNLRMSLVRWGPEADSLHTPRIAGIIDTSFSDYAETSDLDYKFYLGMVTYLTLASPPLTITKRIIPDAGNAYGISTYSGMGAEPESFDIRQLKRQEFIPKVKISGKTIKDVQKYFLENLIDQEFFVCCTSALWFREDDEWEIAILNKNG
jgi:IMP cyclohydrolase